MAGALLYVHSIVLVNISRLVKTVLNVQCDLETMRTGYRKLSKDSSDANVVRLINSWLDILKLNLDGLLSTITDLRAILPRVDNAPIATLTSPKEYRVKRNFPMMIINGIFGTLISWFNQR
jgi:hypothetical protein